MEKKSLNIILLIGIFVSSILSVRNWPISAELGLSSLFFILMGAILFLIPVGLISAELGTGWPSKGGIYTWIQEAFGTRAGIATAWFVWISNVVWYPTILSFIGTCIAYIVSPELAQNKAFLCSLIIASFWGMIYLNLKGTKISGWISSVCLLVGTIIPGILIIGFGIHWALTGQETQMVISRSHLLPKLSNIGDYVFFAGILLGYAGMEMPAAHANEVDNPQKNFPRAIFISTAIILVLLILGTFAVGLVIPRESISLLSAPLDVINIFLVHHNLAYLKPIMALMLGIGALGGVSTWLAGPSKILHAAAKDCALPNWVTTQNAQDMPIGILLFQGVVVSILSLIFLIMPNLNIAFWLLTATSSQLYLIAYILLFIAAIHLRYKRPDVPRKYKITKSNLGVWIISSIGILNALFAITISFFPPSQLDPGSKPLYFTLTVLGLAAFSAVPLLLKEKQPQLADVTN